MQSKRIRQKQLRWKDTEREQLGKQSEELSLGHVKLR